MIKHPTRVVLYFVSSRWYGTTLRGVYPQSYKYVQTSRLIVSKQTIDFSVSQSILKGVYFMSFGVSTHIQGCGSLSQVHFLYSACMDIFTYTCHRSQAFMQVEYCSPMDPMGILCKHIFWNTSWPQINF